MPCESTTEELACVAGARKERAKERTGAREGDTQGVSRVSPSRAPVFSCARYFQAHATQAAEEFSLKWPNTIGFHAQTLKLELRTKYIIPCESTAEEVSCE